MAFALESAAAGKALVAVAVEQTQPTEFGRCRIQVISNAEIGALRYFLLAHFEPGSTRSIRTDWHPIQEQPGPITPTNVPPSRVPATMRTKCSQECSESPLS